MHSSEVGSGFAFQFLENNIGLKSNACIFNFSCVSTVIGYVICIIHSENVVGED
jgi:hypothetical protein